MKRHLLHVFATFTAGGPQVRTARLVNALGSEWRHTVVPMDGRTEARDLVDPGVALELLEAPRGGTLANVRALRSLIREVAADLVLTYNWGAIEAVWAARLAGAPVVHHEDGFRPDEVDGFKLRRVLARRFSLPGVRRLVVPSRTLERIALETWKLGRDKVLLIPNGIRTEDFPRADGNLALRARLEIPEDAFVVGSVGHLRHEKNPVRLVRAFAAMRAKGAHLLMLGVGPERGEVERVAGELGVAERVHLLGHREDTPPFYRAMDAFALSSNTEQMPVALIEAMAAHLPVASTDVGDVAHMLVPEQRDLVVDRDGADVHERLARALDRLAGDTALRARLGDANHERVRERYSFDAMLASYRALYEG